MTKIYEIGAVASALVLAGGLFACSSETRESAKNAQTNADTDGSDAQNTGGSAGGNDPMTSGGSSGSGATAGTGSTGGGSTGGVDAVVDPTVPLTNRVEVIDVPLSAEVAAGSIIRSWLFPGARTAGGLSLGWNEAGTAHITRLDPDMVQEGTDWIIEDQVIVAMEGLPQDGVAVLVTNYTGSLNDSFNVDRQLRLIRLDAAGTELKRTLLVGGRGVEAPEYWFSWGATRSAALVQNGDRFNVFAAASHNFGDRGTHQGDLYIEVDASGATDEATREYFDVSHSNRQHLVLGPDGQGLTLTVGDAAPYGLVYIDQSSGEEQIVWPPEDQREAGEADTGSTIDAGDLCGFERRGDRLFATVSSARTQPFSYFDDNGDIVLLSWPVAGGEVEVTWLTDTPDIPERCPTLTPLGDHQLAVWGARDEEIATVALIDAEGNLVAGPTVTTAPVHQWSMTTTLTDGTVAWTFAEYEASTAQVVLVRP